VIEEGQKVHGGQQRGQVLLAVAEVKGVFKGGNSTHALRYAELAGSK